jgi:hypothetical protein
VVLTPLLHKSLGVESILGVGELPGTVANRLERDNIGVVDLRHGNWRRRREMIG